MSLSGETLNGGFGPRFFLLGRWSNLQYLPSMADFSAHHRLATYGTLAPGRANYGQLEPLRGEWSTGVVRGWLKNAGWGAEQGYPGIALDPAGDAVEVFIFTSVDLPDHWSRLDAFEGTGYRRVSVAAEVGGRSMDVSIYELNL